LQSGPPVGVTVGRVTAVAWPAQQALAVALAQAAAAAAPFPGVGPLPDRPIRLILVPTRATFDSLTRGRLPGWSEGAAFPDAATIVLLTAGPPDRLVAVLRHELAHLALRARVRRPLPLWFEEGYAAVAAGEWGRLDALSLNWQVARGVRFDLDELDRALRADRTEATTAYALANTAVLLLERWGGGHGLEPLIDHLTRDATFDAALRHTYHVTEGDFETRWQRDVAAHYGWLGWASAVGLFWAVLSLVLIWLVRLRRRRDQARKALLDEGWTLPPDDEPTA
jgi:peptidase MA superfamily protein